MKQTTKLTGRMIDATKEREKHQLADALDRQTPAQRQADSRPPTGREKARAIRAGKAMGRGRPRLGKSGTRVVSVTVEAELLKQADAFAAAAGLKRSELFTRGLRGILPKAG